MSILLKQKARLVRIGFLVAYCCCWAKSVDGRARDKQTGGAAGSGAPPFDDALQSYLARFGYLPQDNREMSNLRKDDAVKLALTRLQEFAGIEQTGQLDRRTLRLMASKRCGLPDVPYDGSGDKLRRRRAKRYVLHGSKWHKLNLTYMGYHGDSYPFDGPNVVLAHAFFPAGGLGGDVHFDDDEPWTDDPQKFDSNVVLLSTAAHEIGHSLGMGHSKVQDSLMYPYYKYDTGGVKLEFDDILGVQAIYGIGTNGAPKPTRKNLSPSNPSPREKEEPVEHPVERVTQPSPPSPTTASATFPDPCESHIDAIATIRNEVFVFKNQYYWRFNENGALIERPTRITRFWYGLPENLTKIDAIYERADKNRVIVFIGRLFYEFHGNRLTHGPRDVADLGLPEDLSHVDASFVWEYNGRTYLFSGAKYWRFDEERRVVEPDYPRAVGDVWRRLPEHGIDAAFTDKTVEKSGSFSLGRVDNRSFDSPTPPSPWMANKEVTEEPRCCNPQCNRPIKERAMIAEGKIYHPNCFRCAMCAVVLAEKYSPMPGKIVCAKCWAILQSVQCAGCGLKLETNCYEIFGKKFHVDCLKCKTCEVRLDPKALFPFKDELYCKMHCFLASKKAAT